MSNLRLIIGREYSSRVKKKSFLVTTILVPILFILFMFGAMWLGMKEDKQVKVLIGDPGGWCGNEIYQDSSKNSPAVFYFYGDYIASTDDFMEGEAFKEFDILIMLNENVPANRRVPIVYRKTPSVNVKSYIQNRVEARLKEYFAMKKTNLTKAQYDDIQLPFDFKYIDGLDPTGEDDTMQKAMVGFGFSLLIYLFIFVYSNQVMRGVIEEKTSRIVEIIISSVKPFQLMMGKIIGIGLVGLTQFLVWLFLSGIGLILIRLFVFPDYVNPENWDVDAMNQGLVEAKNQDVTQSSQAVDFIYNRINWPIMILSFFIYFIGGFLIYGSLFAMIGSMVDSETDSQSLVLPVTLPLVLAYLVAVMLISNPESDIGTWFSLIPFTSPVVMVVKIAMNTATLWQYILSIVLLFLTFIATTWFAGKIYRTGILMYGKKTTWKEVFKWIRYK